MPDHAAPDPAGSALSDVRAIVTGAGRGIGQAIAGALARDGAQVVLAGRTRSMLEETAERITAAGGQAHVVPTDATDAAQVASLVATGTDLIGPLNLLVNNAGGSRSVGPLFSMEADEWWADIELNLKTAVLCSRAVLPGFIERGAGRIINLGSLAGIKPDPSISAYSCAKAALTVFSETLATSVAELGIKVFTLSPGMVYTPIMDELIGTPQVEAWMPSLTAEAARAHAISPEVAAAQVVRIAKGDVDALAGRFLHALDDFDALLERADEITDDGALLLRLT